MKYKSVIFVDYKAPPEKVGELLKTLPDNTRFDIAARVIWTTIRLEDKMVKKWKDVIQSYNNLEGK